MDVKRTHSTLTRAEATVGPRPEPTATTDAAPRRGFDDGFARLAPKTDGALLGEAPRTSAAPTIPFDLELVADLTNRRASANTRERRKEETKAREILDANDREIAADAERARENAGRIAQDLNRDAAHASALARAEVDARIAADNGVTPLASKVVKLPSSAPVRVVERPGARLGPGAPHLELRLRSVLG